MSNEAARIAWLEKVLKELPPGLRILDAGAGQQPYKKFCGHLKYVSQDVAVYDGGGDGRGLQTGTFDFGSLDIICDIAGIPEPDGSFDAVMCTEVLEHVPDPLAAIREFARLICHGGQLILTAPFCSLTHFAPFHYSTGFNRYFYETHLPQAGFDIEEMTANGNYFTYLAQEIQRLPSVLSNYGEHRLSLPQRLSGRILTRLLDRCGAAANGSSELLCFGYHVRAIRRA